MATRPNIIVIVIDDLRWDELGVTGHPYMKTPQHRPPGPRGRAVHARVPHDAALLTQPRLDPDRPVREPARDHRQRRPRRREPPAADLPARAPEGGLRDRSRREVAHGQRRLAPARQRLLGQLSRPGQAGRSRAPGKRPAPRRARLRHRPPERASPRVRGAPAPATLRPVHGAQGRASRCVPAPGRHHRPRLARRIRAGRAAPRPLSRPRVRAAAERPAAGGRWPLQAGAGRGVRPEGAGARRARLARLDPRGKPGGDPSPGGDDGLGGRGRRHAAGLARAERHPRPHPDRVRQRQRLLLRRARAGPGAPVRLRGRHPVAAPGALPARSSSPGS